MLLNSTNITSSNLPKGNISINLKGMMALCERSAPRQYEFLCHGDSDSSRSHDLGVRINGKPLSDDAKNFEFYVLNKNTGELSTTNSIAAYNPTNLNDNAYGHVIDLEAVYGRELRKANPLKFSNSIIIKSGVLYTTKLSDYEYSLVDTKGDEIMPPRQIAFEMGIDIFLDENEIGILKWTENGKTHIQEFDNQNDHTIVFDNNCIDLSTYNLKPIISDFPLNFVNIVNDPRILQCDTKEFINIMEGDRAPCAIVGYGWTDGWEAWLEWLLNGGDK